MPKKIPVTGMTGSMYQIAVDLPSEITEGIGKVLAAHAVLENRVQELLFDAMKIEYPQGRVAFENYRDPAVLFGIIRKLFDSWGVKFELNLEDLEAAIRSCTKDRNILAHSIWIRSTAGELRLRVTEGQFSTEEGIHVRAFLPESQLISSDHYEDTKQKILETSRKIIRVQQLAKSALAASPQHMPGSLP